MFGLENSDDILCVKTFAQNVCVQKSAKYQQACGEASLAA
jgi:hypothetical protein